MYYPCPNCRYQIECKARKLSSVYSSVCPVCGKTSYYTLTLSTGNATMIHPATVEKRTPVDRVFQDAFNVGELEI